MKKTTFVSTLLALALCLGLLPVTALADTTESVSNKSEVKVDGTLVSGPSGGTTVTVTNPNPDSGDLVPYDPPSSSGVIVKPDPSAPDPDTTEKPNPTDPSEKEEESAVSYTITFDANGGKFPDGTTTMAIPTEKTETGHRLTKMPDTPTREGYDYGGWGFPEGFDWSTLASDMTVKVKWNKLPEQITLTLDANGGKFSDGSASKTCSAALKGSTYTLTQKPEEPTRDGYTFDGWQLDVSLGHVAIITDTIGADRVSKVGASGVSVTNEYKDIGDIMSYPFHKADEKLLAKWKESAAADSKDEAADTNVTTTKPVPFNPPVTVTPAKPSETPRSAFTDVAATSPFASSISWAVEKGITNGTNGTTSTTFAPGTTCTTGHILTFLWRSQGSPEPTIQNPFKDEIPGAFQKAAIWAYEKGLVSGDAFGSATPCTRAASVTYMWKLAGSPEAKTASFKDVKSSSDYAKAISWAVEKGITNGTGDGTTFSPENTTTRGQIVTFLYRSQVE